MINNLQKASKHNACPICAKTDWCYTFVGNDKLAVCKRSESAPVGWVETSKRDSGGGRYFAIESEDNEWDAERQAKRDAEKRQRESSLISEKQEFIEKTLTAEQRDPLLRELFAKFGLDGGHRESLLERGLSAQQIKDNLYFSVGGFNNASERQTIEALPLGFPGLMLSQSGQKMLHYGRGFCIPTRDENGLYTGWQYRPMPSPKDGAKYLWGKELKLPIGNMGELPIQVVKMSEKKTRTVWLAEGTLKPQVAACLHKIDIIGASSGNFAVSPTLTKKAILAGGYNRLNIAVDAGDAINPDRVRHWLTQADYLTEVCVEHGIKLKWAWWGQETKAQNDLDEILGEDAHQFGRIKFYDTTDFFEILNKIAIKAIDLANYAKLATLTTTPNLTYNEEWVRDIKHKPSTITIISGGVGCGKTEMLARFKRIHEKQYPTAKFWAPSHRNHLAKSSGARLGITHVADLKVGFENYAAINNNDAITYCADSYHNIEIRDVPPHSIMPHDECEAFLKHMLGGTLGDRTADIQTKWVEHCQNVLANKGQLLFLEDNVTQLTVDTLKLLFPATKIDIIVNTHQKFDYPAKIGGHTNSSEFMGAIIDRALDGKKLLIPTASQAWGHQLHKMLNLLVPTARVLRIDSRTNTEHDDFLKDPGGWLATHEYDIVIYTPTIESGVSIVDPDPNIPLFDEVWAYLPCNNVRSAIQLLHRYRSNCSRYIFSPKSTPSNNSKDPKIIYKLERQLTVSEFLKSGLTVTSSNLGEIFSGLSSKFKAREAIGASYNRELLVAELTKRNASQDIKEVDWIDVRAELQSDSGNYLSKEKVGELKKFVKEEILDSDATAIIVSNIENLTLSRAQAILNDGTIPLISKFPSKKVIFADRLPLAPLDDREFVKLVLQTNLTRKLDTRAYFLNPELAKVVSEIKIEKAQSHKHILYYRTPTDRPTSELLQPIKAAILELVESPDGYTNDTPAAIAIAQYAVKNSYEFYKLRRLTFKAQTTDANGVTRHSNVTSTNKILGILGWETGVDSQLASGDRCYKISNAADAVAATYIDCCNRKLKDYQDTHKNLLSRRARVNATISLNESTQETSENAHDRYIREFVDWEVNEEARISKMAVGDIRNKAISNLEAKQDEFVAYASKFYDAAVS